MRSSRRLLLLLLLVLSETFGGGVAAAAAVSAAMAAVYLRPSSRGLLNELSNCNNEEARRRRAQEVGAINPDSDIGEIEEDDRHVEAARRQGNRKRGEQNEQREQKLTSAEKTAKKLARKKERLRLKRIAQRKKKRKQERRRKRQEAQRQKQASMSTTTTASSMSTTTTASATVPLDSCPPTKPDPDTPCTNEGLNGSLYCTYNEQCCPDCCFCHNMTFCSCSSFTGTFGECGQKIYTPCSVLCQSRICDEDDAAGNQTRTLGRVHMQSPRNPIVFFVGEHLL